MAISDQRPICVIVGNCLCILNAFTHFLYLGGGLYVTIKRDVLTEKICTFVCSVTYKIIEL